MQANRTAPPDNRALGKSEPNSRLDNRRQLHQFHDAVHQREEIRSTVDPSCPETLLRNLIRCTDVCISFLQMSAQRVRINVLNQKFWIYTSGMRTFVVLRSPHNIVE